MRLWTAFLLLMLIVNATVSQAQVSRRPTAAVLEIPVQAPPGSFSTLSQAATKTVVTAMSWENLFIVKSRKDTEQAVKDLGFHLPMSISEMQVLGKRLNVDRIMSGEIREISFTEKPRRAHVKLFLSMIDVSSGELAYDIVMAGDSLSTATGSDPMLVEQAIKRASEASFHSLPRCLTAVIRTIDEEGVVVLNRGSRDGLRLGDIATVVRGGARMVRIRIFWVGPAESKAYFQEGSARVRPGNQVYFEPSKVDMEL